MKIIFTLLLAVFTLVATAQKTERLGFARLPVDSTTHLVTYTAVVPIAGASKDELYLRAKEWAARSFVDSKSASRMEDKDAGTLICHGVVKKARTSMLADNGGSYELVLALYTKDGRYKYVIDQINFAERVLVGTVGFVSTYRDGTPTPVEGWQKYRSGKLVDNYTLDLDNRMKILIADITSAMAGKPTSGGAKSDW